MGVNACKRTDVLWVDRSQGPWWRLRSPSRLRSVFRLTPVATTIWIKPKLVASRATNQPVITPAMDNVMRTIQPIIFNFA
jgi:hypothetical protein